MSNGAASESKLSLLHNKLADRMNDALDIDELCTPAMFNSITAFLAKNEITAQVDVGTVSNEQQDRLRALQERRKMKLASISPIRKEA